MHLAYLILTVFLGQLLGTRGQDTVTQEDGPVTVKQGQPFHTTWFPDTEGALIQLKNDAAVCRRFVQGRGIEMPSLLPEPSFSSCSKHRDIDTWTHGYTDRSLHASAQLISPERHHIHFMDKEKGWGFMPTSCIRVCGSLSSALKDNSGIPTRQQREKGREQITGVKETQGLSILSSTIPARSSAPQPGPAASDVQRAELRSAPPAARLPSVPCQHSARARAAAAQGSAPGRSWRRPRGGGPAAAEPGLRATVRLGRRSGGMRRCQGAGLTALAALLLAGMARAQIQQEPFLQTTESTGINITCSHQQIQIGDWIQWYRLLAGRAPELLALTMKETKELPGSAGQLLVSADRRSSALWLAGPRRGDAAVYYCVLGATARGAGAAAGHEPPRAWQSGASRGRCRSARRAPGALPAEPTRAPPMVP